jgi:hypothetical protein
MSINQQQILAAWAEAQRRLLPAVVANVQSNGDQVAVYLKRNQLEFTPENLVDAINALDAKNLVIWEVEPVVVAPVKKSQLQLQQEWDERERQRIEKEAKENAKPFDVAARTKVAEDLQKRQKAQENAQNTINHLLNTWCVYSGPNRIDGSRTAEGVQFLSNIKIARGKVTDYVLTLAVIQKLFHCDSVQEMAAKKPEAVKQVLDAANGVVDPNAAKNERERRMAEERRHGAGTANLPNYSR